MNRNIFKLAMLVSLSCAAAAADSPETVFSTYRVKKGMETEFQNVHAATWAAYRKYKLVLATPHVVVQGKEESSGAPFFVEILTWINHDAPDHVPAEVRELWNKLEAACEKRDGHSGIEFTEMEIVKEN
jgi:hypothetical protein